MDQRPEISAHEAEAIIKGMGREASVFVHDNGLVTATAISANPSNPQFQNEVDEFLSRVQQKYRIVKKKEVKAYWR
jgi:6-phosphofructokinase